ncbi:MAG: DUF2283 domain-containing protein [Planctomycetes bacterium]|nr:DUF2283 domain-containing protein [Planctomycetota bacterium]MBI3833751.1 DUF2283 domain-containing protein [Planctomycetota bacterium]
MRSSKSNQQERLRDIAAILRAVPPLTRLPVRNMFYRHDVDADVAYFSLDHPQRAADSEMRDDGTIIHRRGKKVVGITILDASTRMHGSLNLSA